MRPKHSLLYYPAVEWVRTGIANAVKQHGHLPMVLDCRHLNGMFTRIFFINRSAI